MLHHVLPVRCGGEAAGTAGARNDHRTARRGAGGGRWFPIRRVCRPAPVGGGAKGRNVDVVWTWGAPRGSPGPEGDRDRERVRIVAVALRSPAAPSSPAYPGIRSGSASRNGRMYSSSIPQHPPTTCTPSATHRLARATNSSGVSFVSTESSRWAST